MPTRHIAYIESELLRCERELRGLLVDARGGRWLGVNGRGSSNAPLTWEHVKYFYDVMAKWIEQSGYRLWKHEGYLNEVRDRFNIDEIARALVRIKCTSLDESTIRIDYTNAKGANWLYIQKREDGVIQAGVTPADGPFPTKWKTLSILFDLKIELDDVLSDTTMSGRLFTAFYDNTL
jgi:hypothetical protein